MNITFVLPCSGRYPIGGFRIIYEYANRLTARGHRVTLLHLMTARPADLTVAQRVRVGLQFVRDKLTGGYRPKRWFRLDPRVRARCSYTLSPHAVPPGDAVVASAWQTAFGVAELPPEAGAKFYFIQHFESWNSDDGSLEATWRLPLHKLVIAKWLGAVADSFGQAFSLVPNAVDLTFFRMAIRPEQRPPRSVLLQCHRMDWKGTLDAIAALKLLQERGIGFDLTLFGLKRPEELQIDIPHRFVFNPSQPALRDLYNANAIFVAASWSEGWGLTAHEAAACGAALAVTDINGHREFLEPETSALMSPAQDPESLADHLERLLTDDRFRTDLAYRAEAAARTFTWDRSVRLFEEALKRGIDTSPTSGTDATRASSGLGEERLSLSKS